jgi:hypothetical protein
MKGPSTAHSTGSACHLPSPQAQSPGPNRPSVPLPIATECEATSVPAGMPTSRSPTGTPRLHMERGLLFLSEEAGTTSVLSLTQWPKSVPPLLPPRAEGRPVPSE